MPDATFARPDLTAFARLDELGLEVVGQRLDPDRAVLACRVREPDQWCRRCGREGAARDSVARRLAHEPLGWRPTTLRSRSAATGAPVAGTRGARTPPGRRSRGRRSPAAVCGGRGGPRLSAPHRRPRRRGPVAWNTANDAVLAQGRRVLVDDPARFDGVRVIGVDEHVWRHTRQGDKFVTVIIDLTPIRCGSGPARLLDMIEGRSKQAFKQWLARRPRAWRSGVEVVAMTASPGSRPPPPRSCPTPWR